MKPSCFARAGILALAVLGASCGSAVRQGTGTSFLIINEMEFARGNAPEEFSSNLLSDVVTVVEGTPTFFNDLARVSFSLGLKDPGPASSPLAATQNQAITIDRYSVRYLRADGRNTPGVDVPYGFDGAFTATVAGQSRVESGFTVVRHIAKREAPLAALGTNPVVLSTIAEITFYGRDLTGHAVQATARASIDFGNFAD